MKNIQYNSPIAFGLLTVLMIFALSIKASGAYRAKGATNNSMSHAYCDMTPVLGDSTPESACLFLTTNDPCRFYTGSNVGWCWHIPYLPQSCLQITIPPTGIPGCVGTVVEHRGKCGPTAGGFSCYMHLVHTIVDIYGDCGC